jgi:hypothetical protein
MADLSDVRRRAWQTRRDKYGPQGHDGSYRRPCGHCESAIAMIVRLYREGALSEGQAARATGLDRVELRRRASERAIETRARLENGMGVA